MSYKFTTYSLLHSHLIFSVLSLFQSSTVPYFQGKGEKYFPFNVWSFRFLFFLILPSIICEISSSSVDFSCRLVSVRDDFCPILLVETVFLMGFWNSSELRRLLSPCSELRAMRPRVDLFLRDLFGGFDMIGFGSVGDVDSTSNVVLRTELLTVWKQNTEHGYIHQ